MRLGADRGGAHARIVFVTSEVAPFSKTGGLTLWEQ